MKLACLIVLAALSFGVPRALAQDAGAPAADEDALPEANHPTVSAKLNPTSAVPVGEKLRFSIEASALEGDDVTVPEQSFAPLELVQVRAVRTAMTADRPSSSISTSSASPPGSIR